MRALRSFTVRPSLPAELAALERLAMNLRWSWDEATRDLFRSVDPAHWDATDHDPVGLLGTVSAERLDELRADAGFLRALAEVDEALGRYLDRPRWFQDRDGSSPLGTVAYFSPEYGIAEALPQYSGGLGVLAGDHLKAASDLGVPLVAIGLFYRHGYFRQAQGPDGWQLENYPDLDPWAMALTPCEGVRVTVELAGRPLHAQVWRAEVGRVALYLLDADVDDNDDDLRQVTDRLYGGDTEHRLRQEILLGVGGVRALDALGIGAEVFHTNEGHAGFLGLERMRRIIVDEGLGFGEAVEAVRGGCIFTTHTPVPAGIDRFPRELMESYFSTWAQECGVGMDDLMALGHRPGDAADDRFNMAVMGLRLAGRSNGVSRLHGEVSRDMFDDLWPGVPPDEVPIGSITNGVHAQTWVSSEMAGLLADHVGPAWAEAGPEAWAGVRDVPEEHLWRVRERGREQLVAFVRKRLRSSALARGVSASDVAWCENVLDPGALTFCFARRFATYKRATLLLSQPERLLALLSAPGRPVQFVFAGKAHPADEQGKEMIRRIVAFASAVGVRDRFVFLEDYDIAVARVLYAGADVWLNNPRRPLEACGTSGMKAALNGGLNCSILDGWWDELFDGDNGWAVTSAEAVEDEARRDEIEANSLFELLEHQVVSLFFDREAGAVPSRWVDRVKHSLATIGPAVLATRMVRDYTEQLYEPAAAHAARMTAAGLGPARELATWKARVLRGWDDVRVDSVDISEDVADLGSERSVTAAVSLGPLDPADVEVQLVHGTVGQNDEMEAATVAAMVSGDGDPTHWTATFRCDRPGRYGVTVRILPCHRDLASPVELGRIAWA